jgi:hypothetical protein
MFTAYDASRIFHSFKHNSQVNPKLKASPTRRHTIDTILEQTIGMTAFAVDDE